MNEAVVKLGRERDADDRSDLYDLVQSLYKADDGGAALAAVSVDGVSAALQLTRDDFSQPQLQCTALCFLATILSCNQLIASPVHVQDQLILAIMKDLVYLLGTASLKACIRVAIVISTQALSSCRPTLILQSCGTLIPALMEATFVRFRADVALLDEVVSSVARLAAAAPDTLRSFKSCWAPHLFPLIFADGPVSSSSPGGSCAPTNVNAIVALSYIKPDYSAAAKELFESSSRVLIDGRHIDWLVKRSAEATHEGDLTAIVSIWTSCMRMLGVYVLSSPLWHQMVIIFKNCLYNNASSVSIACLDAWQITVDCLATRPRKLQHPKLMQMLINPCIFVLQGSTSRFTSSAAIRMRAIDLWVYILNAIKAAVPKGPFFSNACAPIISLVFRSNHSAIITVACNILGSCLGASEDHTPSQSLSQLPCDPEIPVWLADNTSHIAKLFHILFGGRFESDSIIPVELEAMGAAWGSFLSALRCFDPTSIDDAIGAVLIDALNAIQTDNGHQVAIDLLRSRVVVVGVIREIPVRILIGVSGSVRLSLASRLIAAYVAAIRSGSLSAPRQAALAGEWIALTKALFLHAREHPIVSERLIDLTFDLLRVETSVQSPLAHSLCANVVLARRLCCALSPVMRHPSMPPSCHTPTINDFHRQAITLLSRAVSWTSARSYRPCEQLLHQQLNAFTQELLESIRVHTNTPFDRQSLRLHYDTLLVQLLGAHDPLPQLALHFWDRTFALSPLITDAASHALRSSLERRLPLGGGGGASQPLSPALGSRPWPAKLEKWELQCSEFESATDEAALQVNSDAERAAFRARLRALQQRILPHMYDDRRE